MTGEAYLALAAFLLAVIAVVMWLQAVAMERVSREMGSAIRAIRLAVLELTTTAENLEKARKAFWAVVSREGGKANRKHKGGTEE